MKKYLLGTFVVIVLLVGVYKETGVFTVAAYAFLWLAVAGVVLKFMEFEKSSGKFDRHFRKKSHHDG